MRSILVLAVIGLAAFALTGCASRGHHGDNMHSGNAMACPMCERGMSGQNVWCDHCESGFVNSQKVTCRGCFVEKTGGHTCPMHSSPR